MVSWWATLAVSSATWLTKIVPFHPTSSQRRRDLHYHAIHARFEQEEGAVCNASSSMTTALMVLSPEGNDRYVRTAPSNPKLTRWHYDDDVGKRRG